MESVKLSEVVDIAQYEKIRSEFRAIVLQEKERRRVRVGPSFTFLFENHLTVLYQVQEMTRIERIVQEKAIQHEVDTYNALIPPTGGISATILIEYDDPAERAKRLVELLGMENHVWLRIGDLPPVKGEFDMRQMSEEKISSVQYAVFRLEDAHRQIWQQQAQAGNIRLVVDHPAYRHDAVLTGAQAAALVEDFSA